MPPHELPRHRLGPGLIRGAWLLALATLLAATLAGTLAGCGAGTDRTKAQLRLVNASGVEGASGYSALDLRIEGSVAQANVAYGSAAGYVAVDPSDADSTLNSAGSGSALLSFTPALSENRSYSLLAYGPVGNLQRLLLDDNEAAPAAGLAKLRVVHAAPDAGALDVYLTAAGDPLATAVAIRSGVAYGSTSGTTEHGAAGNWQLRITGASSKSDLRLDLPDLVLGSGQVATVVITPSRGGVLVNALVLVAKGGIARRDGHQARVRVVAGAAAGGAVSATVGGQPLLAGVGSPAVGLYTLQPAGASVAWQAAVDGVSVAANAPVALLAGADHSLLVYGTAAAPAAGWINDNNRAPTASSTQIRLRLVNGLADLATPLAMTLDFVPAADGVAPGTASIARELDANTLARINVTAAGLAAPLFAATEQALAAGGVYSVFVVGAAAAPTGIVRKDR